MKECNTELRKSKGCNYSAGWRYCPFTGEKIINHREIKMSTLGELTDKHILNEDDLICIVRNGWFYDRFIGRSVILKNDALGESFAPMEMMINDKSSANCKFFELEAVDGVRKMAFGESNSYKDSNIRKWLNNEFYNGFSIEFQEIIRKEDICPDGDLLGDYITIPSVADICCNAKWFNDMDWISSEDKRDGSFISVSVRKHIKENGWYWTRTRNSDDSFNVWYVTGHGNVTYCSSCNDTSGCVVPVFKIGQS